MTPRLLHNPKPRELEPSNLTCATLTISLAAGHFDQGREHVKFTGNGDDKWGMPDPDCVRPTRVCSQALALPCQPLHMLLELQEGCCVEDIRLSSSRDINTRECAQHTRSPLVIHQVTPGTI